MSAVLNEPAVEIPPIKRRMRNYSDRQKAEALTLLDNLGNLSEVSRITGIPDSTIGGWNLDSRGLSSDVAELRARNTPDLASKLEIIAFEAADIIPAKLRKASVKDLVSAIHMAVPAIQLLRGLPTSINASVMSDEDRQVKLAEICARMEARRQAIDVEGREVSQPAEIAE